MCVYVYVCACVCVRVCECVFRPNDLHAGRFLLNAHNLDMKGVVRAHVARWLSRFLSLCSHLGTLLLVSPVPAAIAFPIDIMCFLRRSRSSMQLSMGVDARRKTASSQATSCTASTTLTAHRANSPNLLPCWQRCRCQSRCTSLIPWPWNQKRRSD